MNAFFWRKYNLMKNTPDYKHMKFQGLTEKTFSAKQRLEPERLQSLFFQFLIK